MAEEWLTVEQAAELSRYHPNHIRRLLRSREISGRKWGQTWQVDRDSLVTYLKAAEEIDDKRWGPKE